MFQAQGRGWSGRRLQGRRLSGNLDNSLIGGVMRKEQKASAENVLFTSRRRYLPLNKQTVPAAFLNPDTRVCNFTLRKQANLPPMFWMRIAIPTKIWRGKNKKSKRPGQRDKKEKPHSNPWGGTYFPWFLQGFFSKFLIWVDTYSKTLTEPAPISWCRWTLF